MLLIKVKTSDKIILDYNIVFDAKIELKSACKSVFDEGADSFDWSASVPLAMSVRFGREKIAAN